MQMFEGKNITNKGNNKSESPEVEADLVSLQKIEINVASVQ